jgi:hypothetical protein
MPNEETPGAGDHSDEKYFANMAFLADKLAEAAATGHLANLDFTFHSLSELDALIGRLQRKEPIPKNVVVMLYGYVGETLVRRYGCSWSTEQGFAVLPPPGSPEGARPANAFEMVNARLGKGAVSLQDRVLEHVSAWMPEVSPPKGAGADDLPTLMRFHAETFVRAARITGAGWLDYTPESVARLDAWIDQEWPPNPPKGSYESMIPTIGAYVGEVLVAHVGAHWIKSPTDGFGVELKGVAWPMNRVAKRFNMGPKQSIGQFYREVSSHWLAGTDALPANWHLAEEKRGFFRSRRG